MVATPQIGRKLTNKRKERQQAQRAMLPVVTTPAPTFAPKPLPPRQALIGTEWQQAFEEWTQSHAERPDGLTPDMLRRENLYADDGDA